MKDLRLREILPSLLAARAGRLRCWPGRPLRSLDQGISKKVDIAVTAKAVRDTGTDHRLTFEGRLRHPRYSTRHQTAHDCGHRIRAVRRPRAHDGDC